MRKPWDGVEGMKDKAGLLDKLLGKAISRKFLVFVVATVGLFAHLIDASSWVDVALVFIAGEAVIDSIGLFRRQPSALSSEQPVRLDGPDKYPEESEPKESR